MSRQYWAETVAASTASGTAVANLSAETILIPNVTIPANYMADGRCLRMRIFGGYGTTGTPTLILSVRWGGVSGTVMAKSGAVTTGSGVGGGASMTALWEAEIYIQIRSNGSAGTAMTNGSFSLYTTGTAAGSSYPIASGSTGGTTPATASLDLTADTALAVTATWSAANAANSIQVTNYTLEALN